MNKKVNKITVIVFFIGLLLLTGCTSNQTGGQLKKESESSISLKDSEKKEIAMELVSSAENSSLDWKAQYSYIEDIQDGRGYTAGIIGFCSGTGDMLQLVKGYTETKSENLLAKYIEALEKVNGSDSHEGLGEAFESDWKAASEDAKFQEAQNIIRDDIYFNPAVDQAVKDGLSILGQFIYYDAIVMHGPGDGSVPYEESFPGIREAALNKAKSPADGGNEVDYLTAFLDERDKVMKLESAHEDLSRTIAQRKFLKEENYSLQKPLEWEMYGDPFKIDK
ncbi:chitosanase [Lacrimispora sp.]|uniref:chitosanase n=1 Tax=Lacrimispora sp. TaxID=2719234 RepID=UPI00268185F2|nr:chitosanase [Lacrimispora sp.]